MLKRLSHFSLIAVAALIFFVGEARAEMPQTDADLVKQMDGQASDKVLEALGHYYDLHVSELTVQNMNEQRTGAMFAVQRAKANGATAAKLAQLEQKSKDVSAKRNAEIERNQALRLKLEQISGIEFAETLVMAPDTPMDKPTAPANAPADLVTAQSESWTALQTALAAWREERLILLDAQQRYDETRDVPIGDHLRAMTRAEIALAKAVGDCRIVEAKIAAATGKSVSEMLAAL